MYVYLCINHRVSQSTLQIVCWLSKPLDFYLLVGKKIAKTIVTNYDRFWIRTRKNPFKDFSPLCCGMNHKPYKFLTIVFFFPDYLMIAWPLNYQTNTYSDYQKTVSYRVATHLPINWTAWHQHGNCQKIAK